MNVFDTIPDGFFNCLASSSNHRAYAGCLGAIYEQYQIKQLSFHSYIYYKRVITKTQVCYQTAFVARDAEEKFDFF